MSCKAEDILVLEVGKNRDMILDAERHIWNNPESGYREWKTHAYLKEQYERLGYDLYEMGDIPGFYVDVDTGRPGPKVAVFGEMDALIIPSHPECDPETGAVHACGHHCQSAALLGIAAALKAPGALDHLSGSIRLIAVPAEEGIELGFRKELKAQGTIRYMAGKQEFMYRGALDGVDMAIMVHTGPRDTLLCNAGGNGCNVKEAIFTGKSSHAGGAPHAGVNALYAANCAMQAANALRETFRDDEHIRFHPIITQGGAAVNAIPDRVVVESYVRGATMQAIERENRKINRAFAGAAAAMGCQVRLWDHHGYAPCDYDRNLKRVFYEVGCRLMGEEKVNFTEGWSMGCSDIGDVCCVMPAVQPFIGGAEGASHGVNFRIADPEIACVTSAKVQCGVLARLLEDGAQTARTVLRENKKKFPTIQEYLEQLDRQCVDLDAVNYGEDGTVLLQTGTKIG